MDIWLHGFPVPGTTEAAARSAERLGYAGLLLADSQNLVGDPFVELGLAARVTERLGLGVGVTNPVTRDPSVTAAAIATVHAESQGRAVLGFARGDSALRQIGLEPASLGVFRQALDTLQSYLRGESVSVRGSTARLAWLPADLPKVPLDVAASGPKVIAAGAVAAERVTFNLGAEPGLISWALTIARRARESAGLDPEAVSYGAYVNVACDDDVAIATAMVRGSASVFARFAGEAARHGAPLPAADRVVAEALAGGYRESAHGLAHSEQASALPEVFLRRFALVGAPAELTERIAELSGLGLERLVAVPASRDADPSFVAESNERFAAEVLPHFGRSDLLPP
ncbi:LLM class flavin-dependent oxidoreductase [Streptomyces sp. NPDC055709]